MWSSGQPDDTIGESEAREFAWCTTPGHGTRVIPPGTITGAQWLYAKNYLQVVGFLDQTQVNLNVSDLGGGELFLLLFLLWHVCSIPRRQNWIRTAMTNKATRSAASSSPTASR